MREAPSRMAAGPPSETGAALAVSAAAALVDIALWHDTLLASARGGPGAALLGGWLVMVWGLAPGALTLLVLRNARRRLPGPRALPVAAALSLALAWALSALLYAFLTDPGFRQAAMGGPGHAHPVAAAPHTGHPAGASPAVGLPVLLVPITYAVVFTVIRGQGGRFAS
ncbi:hypothetical protein [Streptomyces lichenis]|uniref:Uncharacterized protein n=1 Tax=Streptomyces lichenis TaxID=2306967 RepID=A0ABT0IJJ4_9ACTN|nr:hypothetical protein [Streptomyces lichenis]MCK8681437.1 hypothetical protein [Streptomyces lichenis]